MSSTTKAAPLHSRTPEEWDGRASAALYLAACALQSAGFGTGSHCDALRDLAEELETRAAIAAQAARDTQREIERNAVRPAQPAG